MDKSKKNRDSRFELLRIVAIFMVVMSHFAFFGQEYRLVSDVSISNMIGAKIFSIYGQIGVDLFVLITGYFMCHRTPTLISSINRSWKIWAETFFYTTILFVVICVYNQKLMGIKDLAESIFPFTFSTYWFITSYIMLVMLLPFINKLLNILNKKIFLSFIVISILFNDVLPIVHNYNASYEHGLGVILTAYLIGAYIRLFGVKINHKWMYLLICLLMMYFVMDVGALILGPNRGKGVVVGIFPLIVATLTFLIVSEMKPFHSNIINKLATTVFAGYIITEYPLLRMPLWKFLGFSNISNSYVAALLGLISVAFMLYVVIFIIDIIRQKIFEILRIDDFPNCLYKKFLKKD